MIRASTSISVSGSGAGGAPGRGADRAIHSGLSAANACANGAADEAEFRRLFDAHRDAVGRMLLRLVRNRADAEDLLQETFLTVWRKRSQFTGRGSAEGWLKRTAFRTYLNSRVKQKRRERLDGGVPRPAAEPTSPPADGDVAHRDSVRFLAARLDEALLGLPDEMREAFVLFRYEGLTCAEIGEMTGSPTKTVETRVRRATAALAERLAPWRDQLGARP